MNGTIIVIEGLDGCGKSTQVELLRNAFPEWKCVTFPNYESESGAIITQYLRGAFAESNASISAYSATSFYAIDRYISLKQDWEAAYRAGTTILSARYTTSNAIYQMAKLPQTEWADYSNWLMDYEYNKLGIPKPDLVLYLDMPLDVSQQLLMQRYAGNAAKKDIHESNMPYLQACREAAQYLYEQDHGKTWQVLPCCSGTALRSVTEMHQAILQEIKKRFS